MKDKLYWFWFTSMLQLNRKQQERILKKCYHPKEFFRLKDSEAMKFLSKEQQELFCKMKHEDLIKRRYEQLFSKNITYILCNEAEYPNRLKQIYDYPYGIFRKGKHMDAPLVLAIVGSRNPTAYGIQMARIFAEELAKRGVVIVSGLAKGIDGRSHLGALYAHGKTIGVLGCGIDQIYPKENKNLYRQMESDGCIYSEYGLGIPPLPMLFPQRNRIISGLSDGILVVEAEKKSGSLITVDCGLDQNREIYAIPGNINSPLSAGCHHLIQQGAKLVQNYQDILDDFPKFNENRKKVSQFTKVFLDRNEKMVYDVLSLKPLYIEEIVNLVDLSLSEVMEALFYLEEKRYIRQISPNYYIK